MNILYLITGLGLGGAEKVVVDLADQMLNAGHLVKIVYLKGDILVYPKSPKIELVCLNLNSPMNFYSAFKAYKETILSFQPDVVHAHMVHANIFARLSRIFITSNKLICSAHSSDEGGKLRMLAYKYTNFLSDINTNVSRYASESMIEKGAFPTGVLTIYNGIDLNKFVKKKKIEKLKNLEEIKFLSIGRFNEAKDYPNLFNAIVMLKNYTAKKIKFYIAGDGELRPMLEDLIHSLNIQEEVELLGRRSDIPELLSGADFFILSSKHEGLPTVVIEAMACDCFVIATNCGGSAEIMGDTGILVKPQDSKELANGVIQALQIKPEILHDNNRRARQRVENLFTLEKSVNAWLSLYESK